jgi:hypothetical protein
MTEWLKVCGALALAAGLALAWPAAQAQKIVCWKDKSGKVVGCGDRVPPEYQQNESRVLDNQGIARKTNVSAEEAARQKEEAARKAALKAEEDRKIAEQRRLDSALMNTYTSEKEIDLRRDRELQVVDLQIQQLTVSLKNATEAQATVQKRYESAQKGGKPSAALIEELARANDEKKRLETRIAEKQKDKEDIAKRYAEQKARFIELRGAATAAPAPAAAAPAAKK